MTRENQNFKRLPIYFTMLISLGQVSDQIFAMLYKYHSTKTNEVDVSAVT